MRYRKLKQKQQEDNDYWVQLWASITHIIPREYIDRLVERTVAEILKTTHGLRAAYCWSGGKDSQALRGVCELAGIQACLMGMSNLEYPEFLCWVTDHMPWELTIINTGQDLDWLVANPGMLFPQDSATAAKWFQIIQHRAQTDYVRRYGWDMILLGRRHQDGNFTGRDRTGVYTNNLGITRYSPIRHWTHEETMAFCAYYEYDLPPFYDWPNGWVVGTGSWPARQWTGSIENGWYEVWLIDPSIVAEAAERIPSAAAFLRKRQAMQARLDLLRSAAL